MSTLNVRGNNDSGLPFRVDSVNGEKGKDLGGIRKKNGQNSSIN